MRPGGKHSSRARAALGSRRTLPRRHLLVAAASGGVLAALGAVGAGVRAAFSRRSEPAAVRHPRPPSTPARPAPQPPETSTQAEPPQPVYDLDHPDSLTVVVNKQRPLNPIDWAPDDLVVPQNIPNVWGHPLRAEAASALEQLHAAAAAAGLPFTITSGYRDYWLQRDIYDGLVAEGGVEYADRDTARPGHSEHQTGLAVDVYGAEGCQLDPCFGETATGLWLRDNAHQFGYILRYHDGEQATVGYAYEPWHFRYIGVPIATAMHDQGVRNLEDFFQLAAAPIN